MTENEKEEIREGAEADRRSDEAAIEEIRQVLWKARYAGDCDGVARKLFTADLTVTALSARLKAVTLENIERIEWTMRDPDWQPTRSYVEKMLASYKELVRYHGYT